jgi:hypothetical protein
VNLEARRLSWDFELLASLPEVLPQQSPLGNKARALANKIMNTFDGTMDSVRECRQLAEDVMGKGWQEDANKQTGQEEGTLWALGYCHIDTAWYVVVTIPRKRMLMVGYGHGAQLSKKSLGPGQVKSRYPTDTPSSDSLPRQLNTTNGLRNSTQQCSTRSSRRSRTRNSVSLNAMVLAETRRERWLLG